MTKYQGLKKTIGQMPAANNNGLYLEVHYDLNAARIITHLQCSFGHNSWTQYHKDENVVFVGNYDQPCTMKQLEKDIDIAIAQYKALGQMKYIQ